MWWISYQQLIMHSKHQYILSWLVINGEYILSWLVINGGDRWSTAAIDGQRRRSTVNGGDRRSTAAVDKRCKVAINGKKGCSNEGCPEKMQKPSLPIESSNTKLKAKVEM